MTEKSTVAANVLGTIGTVLWCIQLIPQIIHNYRRKNCEGLPSHMMLLWAISGVPFAIYFIVQQANVPVQVQPHVFLTLSLVCWYQCMIYPPISYKKTHSLLIFALLMCIFAGVEAGCVFPFKSLYKRHITWPNTFVGVIAAVLLGVGLLPPYWELYKRHGRVVGLNFIFLAIDTGGAVFSLLSLVTQNGPIDILGIILYCVIIVLEGGIYISQFIWMVRTQNGKNPIGDEMISQIENKKQTAVYDEEVVTGNDDENEGH